MKKLSTSWKAWAMVSAMCLGLSQLIACGINAPTTQSIEDHVLNPTGHVDATSLSNAFKWTNSGITQLFDGPSLQLSSKGKASTKEQPLTAKELLHFSLTPHVTLARVGVPKPATMWLQPKLRTQNDANQGLILQNKAFTSECLPAADLKNKYIDVKIDMACLAKGSGEVHIITNGIGLADAFQNPEELSGQLSVRFNNACDNKGNCINGHYRMDLDVSKSNKRLNVVIGYSVEVKIKGKTRLNGEGGLQVKMTDGKSEVNVVTFVEDKDGQKGSIVLQIASDGKMSSFAVKGANGAYRCQSNQEDGSGRCQASQGNDDIAWQF